MKYCSWVPAADSPHSRSSEIGIMTFIVCCEGEGNLQLSSFPDVLQNKGTGLVKASGLVMHKAGMGGTAGQETLGPRPN